MAVKTVLVRKCSALRQTGVPFVEVARIGEPLHHTVGCRAENRSATHDHITACAGYRVGAGTVALHRLVPQQAPVEPAEQPSATTKRC